MNRQTQAAVGDDTPETAKLLRQVDLAFDDHNALARSLRRALKPHLRALARAGQPVFRSACNPGNSAKVLERDTENRG